MRFIGLSTAVAKVRRFVSGSATVQDEEVKDSAKLANILRAALQRVTDLEAKVPPEGMEFELVFGTSGALKEIPHNLGSQVRWWVTTWTQTSGTAYPVAGPQLVQDASSTDNSLFLRSYVAGRAVVRIEAGASIDPGVSVTPIPAVSAFTAIQSGGRSTTMSDSRGGILIQTTNGINGEDQRVLKKTAPTAPYTLTVHVTPTLFGTTQGGAGICWRAASTGNMNFYGVYMVAGVPYLLARNTTASNNGTSPTYTYSADVIAVVVSHQILMGDGLWLRLVDDNTNRTWWYSNDGFDFIQVATVGRTSFFTPDEIGIWAGNTAAGGTAVDATAFFDSWVTS